MKKQFIDLAKAFGYERLSYCTYIQLGFEHYQLVLKDADDLPYKFNDLCEKGDKEARKKIIKRFTEFLKGLPA